MKFSDLLTEAGNLCSKMTIFIDGIDLLDDIHQALSLDWIPETIPEVITSTSWLREHSVVPISLFTCCDQCPFTRQRVVFVLSSREGTPTYTAALRRQPATAPVPGLDLLDKAVVVRATLAAYRKQLDESPFNNQVFTCVFY